MRDHKPIHSARGGGRRNPTQNDDDGTVFGGLREGVILYTICTICISLYYFCTARISFCVRDNTQTTYYNTPVLRPENVITNAHNTYNFFFLLFFGVSACEFCVYTTYSSMRMPERACAEFVVTILFMLSCIQNVQRESKRSDEETKKTSR